MLSLIIKDTDKLSGTQFFGLFSGDVVQVTEVYNIWNKILQIVLYYFILL